MLVSTAFLLPPDVVLCANGFCPFTLNNYMQQKFKQNTFKKKRQIRHFTLKTKSNSSRFATAAYGLVVLFYLCFYTKRDIRVTRKVVLEVAYVLFMPYCALKLRTNCVLGSCPCVKRSISVPAI